MKVGVAVEGVIETVLVNELVPVHVLLRGIRFGLTAKERRFPDTSTPKANDGVADVMEVNIAVVAVIALLPKFKLLVALMYGTRSASCASTYVLLVKSFPVDGVADDVIL